MTAGGQKRKPGPDWAALSASLDANGARLAALNAAVTLAAGKPPGPEELALAAAAREGLAAVVADLPPSALWGATGPAPLPAAARAARTADLAAGLGLLPFAPPAAKAAPPAPPSRPRTVLVLAGPCGAGKSAAGAALAARCGDATPFLDGDAYHTAEAKTGMAAGVPLNEDDRSAWLERVGTAAACAAGMSPSGRAILACSALGVHHRLALDFAIRAAPGSGSGGGGGTTDVSFVLLLPPRPVLEARLAARGGAHFMSPSLLGSQLRLVDESGGPGLKGVVRKGSVEEVVAAAAAAFGV